MSVIKNEQLRVTAVGLNKQALNTLQLFFQGHCAGKFQLVDQRDADISLVDMDSVNGPELLQHIQREFPRRPCILQSVNDIVSGSGILLRKPVNIQELSQALTQAAQEVPTRLAAAVNMKARSFNHASSNIISFEEAASPVRLPTVTDAKQARSAAATAERKVVAFNSTGAAAASVAVNAKPAESLTATVAAPPTPAPSSKRRSTDAGRKPSGKVPAVTVSSEASVKEAVRGQQATPAAAAATPVVEEDFPVLMPGADELREAIALDTRDLIHVVYNPEYYLQGYLKKALQLSYTHKRDVVLESQVQTLHIIYQNKKVLFERSERALYAAARVPITNEHITMSLLGDDGAYAVGQDTLFLDWDQVMWELSLRASHGRIPIGTDLQAQFYLKHTPDSMRFHLSDNDRKIVEFWRGQPRTLAQSLQQLEIPQSEIFSLYSTARALGFIKLLKTDPDRRQQVDGQHAPAENTAEIDIDELAISTASDDESVARQGGILQRLYSRLKGH